MSSVLSEKEAQDHNEEMTNLTQHFRKLNFNRSWSPELHTYSPQFPHLDSLAVSCPGCWTINPSRQKCSSPYHLLQPPFPPHSHAQYLAQCARERERYRKMKGTSKVIMGATLVMVVTLAIVLGLVMVLLVELYCSLLLRRRKELRTTSSTANPRDNANNSPQQPQNQSETPSLSSFGVLRAPRSLLFPAVSGKNNVDVEKQNPEPPQISESQTQKSISTSHQFKILYASPPSPPLISVTLSQPLHKVPIQGDGGASTSSNGVCSDCKENIVYISNPMYDNETSQQSRVDTPFGTPDSSPSRLEMGGSSGGDDDDDDITTLPTTPPLSPMKKLPAEACSVSLRDARSLATSGSDSNSNNGLSSSSSGSPSTSPSW